MNEHEMCCGTTCDKQAVAEEFERLAERNRSLEGLLKLELKGRDNALSYGSMVRIELETVKNERNELAAQVERFKSVVEAVANIGVDFGYGAYEIQPDTIDFARAILSDQPPAALAALKAEWQAEAIEQSVKSCKLKVFDGPDLYSDAVLYCASELRQRAQGAGDDY